MNHLRGGFVLQRGWFQTKSWRVLLHCYHWNNGIILKKCSFVISKISEKFIQLIKNVSCVYDMYHTFNMDGLTRNQSPCHRQCWCRTLHTELQSQLLHLHLSYMQRSLTHNMYCCFFFKTSIHSLLGETQNSLSLEFNMM